MTTRGKQLALLLLAFIAALSTACNKHENAPSPDFRNQPLYKGYTFSKEDTTIELGVPTPWSTVNHLVEVMKRDELLKKDLLRIGHTVTFHPFLKGDDIVSFIEKGELEGAIAGDMPTLRMAATDTITVLSLFHKGSVSLVTRNVYRVKDLKEKRVAYPYGSIAHYFLLKLLEENGMSGADIRQRPMDTRDMLEAIEQKRIDAFSTFEPTATVYTKMEPTLHTISRSFSSYAFFSLRTDYVLRHPEAARALLAAQFRAMAWLAKSDRNLDRASRWVAEQSLKVSSLPLNNYTTILNALCSEDLLSNVVDYKKVEQAALADNGDMRKEFDFLKIKGLVPQNAEWEKIKSHFAPETASAVLKNMTHLVSEVRP